MTMYLITRTAKFKRAYKLAVRRGLNMSKLNEVIGLLAMGEPLPARCRDHELVGRYVGKRECHVAPDWLLVYRKIEAQLILELLDTGSHSDLRLG
jgi:mRNA interferase YafQ